MRGNRTLVGSFAIDLAAMTFGMPRALFAVLALTVYDAGASGTGLLYASVSAGATIAVADDRLDRARALARADHGRRGDRLGRSRSPAPA